MAVRSFARSPFTSALLVALVAATLLPSIPAGVAASAIARAPSTTACAPAPPGLVGWWKLDGDATDRSGANPGTIVGSGQTFPAAEVGSGFHPSGTGNFIEVASSPSLAVTNLTFDAWIEPESLTYLNSIVLYKGASGYDYTTPFGMGLVGTIGPAVDEGKAYFIITDGTAENVVHSSARIPLGSFTHVAATADGATLALYINGVLDATVPQTVVPLVNDTPLRIGGQYDSEVDNNTFIGTIDEVELHDVAATAAQIAAIHAAGHAGKCPDLNCAPSPPALVGWWKLDGDARDFSGQHPGAVTGPGGFFAAGEVGQGFHPAPASNVTIPYSPSLQVTNFTVDAWVKLDSIPYANPSIFWNGDFGGANVTGTLGLGLCGSAKGSPAAGHPVLCIGNGTQFQNLDAGVAIPIGSFVHLAGTADGSTLRLYIDGALAASAPQALTPAPTAYDFQIGGEVGPSGGLNDFTGVIDEVELHAEAASPEQIAAIYAAGPSGKCAGTLDVPRHREPGSLSLTAAPNPTFDRVALRFTLPRPTPVWLEIFDVSGRRVRQLAQGRVLDGPQRVDWDGRTASGHRVARGVYYARLRTPSRSVTRRIVSLNP